MRPVLLLLPLLALASACENNIGRAFDRGGGGGGGDGNATGIEPLSTGGIVAEGRPKARAAFPSGAGWPLTVPIVVIFSESMSADSIAPQQGSPTLALRVKGTPAPLPATYDFLLGNQVVVMRPLAPLLGDGTEYEVALQPEASDVDGVRIGGTTPQVLTEFTPDRDPAQADGRILVTLPRDNERDRTRETPIYAIFDRPALSASVNRNNFRVQTSAGAPVPGGLSFPLQGATGADGRVLRFDPDALLPGGSEVQVFVEDTIEFADSGKLGFGGRAPFARFRTLEFAAPQSVRVGNISPGFPDKVNRGNFDNLQLDVVVGSSALADDELRVRLYGLDTRTQAANDVDFVERRARLALSGAQTVTVDFAQALGTLASPIFADGGLVFAVQLARGSRATAFVASSGATAPRLDVTPPTLTTAGPPTGPSATDLVTDQEFAVFFGTANERIVSATLTAGTQMETLFASSDSGRFTLRPLALVRNGLPLDYQLTITDTAGNLVAAAVTGTIVQRGFVTGSVVSGGTLVVEAYDDSTLRAIAGATVLVEPGLPTKPPTGRSSAITGADGRATFTGLTAPTHTITIVAPGRDLKTLLDSGAGFVSLPLRPSAAATATFTGRLAFQATPGMTGVLGSNLFDDRLLQEARTTSQAPNDAPPVAIRPNRPHVVTGFAGPFEPTATPAYVFAGCGMCGTTGAVLTPPLAAAAGGSTATGTVTLTIGAGTAISLAATYVADFAAAAGLDTANLSEPPTVRVVGGLRGFPGMPLFGAGFAVAGAGATFTINGTYSFGQVAVLTPFDPVLWVSTQARDTGGNVARHRRFIANNTLGTTFPTVDPPGIPTVTAPSGSFADSPEVTYQDRLEAALLPGGIAFTELIATDNAGRRWSIVRGDTDGSTGAVTVQLPALAGSGVVGLAPGTWTIRAENTLLLSTTQTAADYVLEEMRRQEVTWSRAAPKTFTVN
jgi:hypothetical protein